MQEVQSGGDRGPQHGGFQIESFWSNWIVFGIWLSPTHRWEKLSAFPGRAADAPLPCWGAEGKGGCAAGSLRTPVKTTTASQPLWQMRTLGA